MDFLRDISIRILQSIPEGLTKVKFAKVIYFVHKELVINDIYDPEELGYIRMPLGPVPDGFMNLNTNEIVISQVQNQLSFNAQIYKCERKHFDDSIQNKVVELVTKLNTLSTYELVDASHSEPSWKSHENGEKYFITTEDLGISFPGSYFAQNRKDFSDQNLQAKLVEGMLDDIVDESTLLEYPAN
jgi:uncharacterized phage-associated protein